MAMLLGGPPVPPPEPVVLDAGWDGVGGHARVVRTPSLELCPETCTAVLTPRNHTTHAW